MYLINFYENIYNGYFEALMRQDFDKYSHGNGQIVKHKFGNLMIVVINCVG